MTNNYFKCLIRLTPSSLVKTSAYQTSWHFFDQFDEASVLTAWNEARTRASIMEAEAARCVQYVNPVRFSVFQSVNQRGPWRGIAEVGDLKDALADG